MQFVKETQTNTIWNKERRAKLRRSIGFFKIFARSYQYKIWGTNIQTNMSLEYTMKIQLADTYILPFWWKYSFPGAESGLVKLVVMTNVLQNQN